MAAENVGNSVGARKRARYLVWAKERLLGNPNYDNGLTSRSETAGAQLRPAK